MKKFTALCVWMCAAAAWSQAKFVLPVDAGKSLLTWTGHAEVGGYAPTGTLNVKAGSLAFRDGQFTAAKIDVDMTSLKQDNADLTKHLKSEDFFDVEKFPAAVITLTKAENGTASGTLTIRGKVTPFETPIKVAADDKQFTVTGTVTLDRTKYGITYNSTSFFSGLGNKAIRNTFEVTFKIVGEGKLPEKYRK